MAATGPSLDATQAQQCLFSGWPVLAVNDAYRLFSWAEVLYACDARWWDLYEGAKGFAGERWSSHSVGTDDKMACAEKWGLKLIRGQHEEGFSLEPDMIHYGANSGIQGINLALHFGARKIVLVGFDMRTTDKRHFFGDHPSPLSNSAVFEDLVPRFTEWAKTVPPGVEIVNATPGSALTCWPKVRLEEALR